mmetsp:Transcript_59319/g.129934  ORF Transcript_59319/g.129934 Transcript_59319/m.129934 type:complete len:262 (+) Transcript_59319:430-1215(+)
MSPKAAVMSSGASSIQDSRLGFASKVFSMSQFTPTRSSPSGFGPASSSSSPSWAKACPSARCSAVGTWGPTRTILGGSATSGTSSSALSSLSNTAGAAGCSSSASSTITEGWSICSLAYSFLDLASASRTLKTSFREASTLFGFLNSALPHFSKQQHCSMCLTFFCNPLSGMEARSTGLPLSNCLNMASSSFATSSHISSNFDVSRTTSSASKFGGIRDNIRSVLETPTSLDFLDFEAFFSFLSFLLLFSFLFFLLFLVFL